MLLVPYTAGRSFGKLSFVFATVLALTVSSAVVFEHPAWGQAGTADLVGTVHDTSGAVLSDAKVTLTNVDTNLQRTVQTSKTGDYAFTLLPIGQYRLAVEAKGFKQFTAADINLATGDRSRVNVEMTVGSVSETVEVQASSAGVLQTDSSAVGGLITERSVQDLPLNGRNVIQLATLTPGANEGPANALSNGTRPDDRRQTSAISANGQTASSNNYLLDGLDNNERVIGTIVVKPSIDALQEVKVQTSLFTAESGRAAGAVINMMTKSGTNRFHGDAFEFFRNDIFDANSYFNVPQAGNPLAGHKPKLRQNQFGGSLGGPIIKDRFLFFADFEEFRLVKGIISQPSGSGLVPTACELGLESCNGIMQLGNFSDDLGQKIYDQTGTQFSVNGVPNVIPSSQINSISRTYASFLPSLPQATCGSALAASGCIFRFSPNQTQNSHTGDVRLDQHFFGDKDTLLERYTINDVTSAFPGAFPTTKFGSQIIYPGGTNGNAGTTSFPGTAKQRSQSIAVSETHIFRPTLLLQTGIQGLRYASQSLQPNADVAVNNLIGGPLGVNSAATGTGGLAPFSFGGAYSLIGDAFALPTEYFDTDFQGSAALTWTHGSHTAKFGVNYIRRYWNVINGITKGNFTFSTNQTNVLGKSGGSGGNAFASMLLGFPASETQSFPLVPQQYRSHEFGLYGQDDWRVNGHLTLNLGLRWDVFTPTTEKHNYQSRFDPTDPATLAGARTLIAGQNGVSSTLNLPTTWTFFQPRVGFAWTMNHGVVVRGGFGMTNYPNTTASPAAQRAYPFNYSLSLQQSTTRPFTLNINTPLPTPPSFSLTKNCIGPSSTCGADVPSSGTLSAGGIQHGFQFPTIYQVNMFVEKQLAGNVLQVGYLGEFGRNLGVAGVNENLPLPPFGPGGCGKIIVQLPNSCQPYNAQLPNVTNTSLLESYGLSNYNSLQTQIQRRFSHGLTFSVSYNYASALTNTGGAEAACGSCNQVLNDRERDYGWSDFLIRHRFVTTVNYQVPFGSNLQGYRGVLIKGWQTNAIFVHSTGAPFTVTDSENLQGNTAGGYRVNVRPGGSAPRTLSEWFDTTAFQQQAVGTAGNERRNQYFGPNFTHFDGSVFKDFKVGEGMTVQFRAEAFNLFNTPVFAAPNSSIPSWIVPNSNPLTPLQTCKTDGSDPNGPNCIPFHTATGFGSITSTSVNYTPRDFQFALKLSF
jgi:hypothetical protein